METALFLLAMTLSAAAVSGNNPTGSEDHIRVRKCEPIRVDMCRGLGYNVTGLPNLVGHESQPDAEQQLRTFTPLIQYGCSAELTFFLCAVYAPMCTEMVREVIGPCRSVCVKVRESCEPILHQFGFPWPAGLNCSKFHPFNDNNHMCMEGSKVDQGREEDDLRKRLPSPTTISPVSVPVSRMNLAPSGNCQHLSQPDKFVYSNRTKQCLLLCGADYHFGHKDKNILDIWLIVCSIIGLLSTTFVLATFLVDVQRFGFTERHVVLMSSCFGMCSIAYLVRVIAGRHAISCVPVDPLKDYPSVLAKNGLASSDCTILFVLLYYFTMAGIVWWLIMTFTWLFVAGFHWTVDMIQRLGTYFHIVAWTVPAIQVIIILVRKNIEPNEFTGMCHVTADDSEAVVGFLLAPMGAYLAIGITFLGGGLLGFCQTKVRLNRESRTDDSTYQADLIAAVRAATFSVLCAVPLLGLVACVLYGYITFERSRYDVDYEEKRLDESVEKIAPQKSVSVFLIEILMIILVGVFAAVRTLLSVEMKQSWKGFLRRRCRTSAADGFHSTHLHSTALSSSYSIPSYRLSQWDRDKQKKSPCLFQGSACSRCLSADHSQMNGCRTYAKQQLLSNPVQYMT